MSNPRRSLLAVATATALTACSGGGPSIPSAGPAGAPGPREAGTPKRFSAELHVFIPRAPRHARGRQLRPFFVATSTQGISVIVFPHGSTTPATTTNVGVGPTSPLCHAVSGGRSCTITAGVPAGNDDFVVKTYDAQPTGGSFSGAKQLAVGTTTAQMKKGKSNALSIAVGGVVAKGAVALASPSIPVIDNDSQTVTVNALDADGNTIINNGWYDANGNAVTMALSGSNNTPVALGFAPATVSFAANTSTLTYTSSQASPSQVQNGFTSSISATPTSGTAGSATLTLTKPAFTEFSISTASSYPTGIVVGPDNAIWFAECLVNKIGRITTNAAPGTHPQEFSTGMSSGASPTALAVAPDDQKIWFTENGTSSVASIDPTSHAIKEYTTKTASSSPYGITAGPDGNMWIAETATSNVAKFNATQEDGGSGTMTEYATKTLGHPEWITTGPDGNMWFTEQATPPNDLIGTIKTNGTGANDFALPANSIGDGQIVNGSDGALWFTENNPNSGDAIGRISTTGAVTLPHTFPAPPPQIQPQGITTGPDGALWFVEACLPKIGRIDSATHTLVEFTLTGSNLQMWGIVKGPDGALWFTENAGNKVGKLQ